MIIGKCISCGGNIVATKMHYSRFKCPECGAEIMRCEVCKAHGNTYVCAKCGFEGP
ncbi:MAG: DUF1610 domain-containing protein [Candidatus Nanohaloarchaeota archaeon]|nr:DUF1610 domain-containing protein [Candidatus Nanohaloarchaeota archaeon]